MTQIPSLGRHAKFNSLPVLLGGGVICVLLASFAIYHYSVSQGPPRFPVTLNASIREERKLETIRIDASISIHAIEQAIETINRIDPRHVFSISNPPLPQLVYAIPSDPRNFDQSRLVALAGENNSSGRSEFTTYTLRVQGDIWTIEKQEKHVVERDP